MNTPGCLKLEKRGDILSLDGEMPGEEAASISAMDPDGSLREEPNVEALSLNNELSDDEYDEELISIFLKKLKTDIEYIQARIGEYQAGGDKKTILNNCHDAIGHLASSANYMEYASLTSFCELWQSVVEGYLADVSAGIASDIIAGLQEFVDKIIGVYPQIIGDGGQQELGEFSGEENGGFGNDETFSGADKGMVAFASSQGGMMSLLRAFPRRRETTRERLISQSQKEELLKGARTKLIMVMVAVPKKRRFLISSAVP